MKNQLVDPGAFLSQTKPEKHARYPYTDLGDGRLLADCYKQVIIYVPERKCWYVYRDGIWVQDLGGLQVMEYCKSLAVALKAYAQTIKDEDIRDRYVKYCRRWQNRRAREIIIKDAQSIRPISIEAFDQDSNVLNCRNGTLHLDTMVFAPHNSEDLLTKMAPVDYVPSARCDRFQCFVDEIMSGDVDKAKFVRRAFGYAISGDTRHECMFVLYGETTRNGKSTLCESVRKVMGSYGCSASPETIGIKNFSNGSSPSDDVARLAGIRYVNCSEPDKGLVFGAALVKALTGNNTITARHLYENSFEFMPKFKIFMDCNHLPLINDMTLFSSGRMIIIPFDRHFNEHEQDKSLKTLFAQPENQSAILNWLIEGYRMLQEEGLNPPASVRAATGIYKEEIDYITQFIRDQLIEIPSTEVRTSAVYARYRQWCDDNGIPQEKSSSLNAALRQIATITRKRPNTGGGMTTMLIGYQLVPVVCNDI